jgi:hypothetical protein
MREHRVAEHRVAEYRVTWHGDIATRKDRGATFAALRPSYPGDTP